MVKFISKPIITSQTIGERFIKTRQGSGWPLVTVARQIGIKENYLQAIEAGRYNELPGDIYALEFVKAYARFLRLDETEAIRGYLAERVAQSVVKVKKTSARPIRLLADWARQSKAGLIKCLAGAFGFALLVVAINFTRQAFLPPRLEVFSPAVYYEATGSLVVLSGQTEPGSSIFINNEAIFTDDGGAFNETINLPAGVTLLKIVAKNSRGQEQVAYRTVRLKAGQIAGVSVKRGDKTAE